MSSPWEELFGLAVRREIPLQGGNSRVTLLECGDGRTLVAKRYFRHPDDPRDRQATEASALRWLEECGEGRVPRLLAVHRPAGVSLLEFVAGAGAGSPTDRDMDLCADFLCTLARLGRERPPRDLGRASEACFSLEELAGNLEQRLARLLNLPAGAGRGLGLRDFLRQRLAPELGRRLAEARDAGDGQAELPVAERIPSPSDFGLHNALRRPVGDLAFLDMEYFGWDDPAKTVCDFAMHPGMPVPPELFGRFAARVLGLAARPAELARRCARLFPLYRLKWCLILLNEFTACGGARRREAGIRPLACEVLRGQLAKAGAYLDTLEEAGERFRASLA